MKKVLYIHHGDINGGAPRSLRFLIEKLDKTRFCPIVVYRGNEVEAEFFKEAGAQVICEQGIKPFHGSTVSGITLKQIIYNFVYALPTYFATKKIIEDVEPDIVHINSTCLFMCAAAAKKIDNTINVICHVREPLLSNIWGKILQIMSNKYCDKFVAIDEFDGHSVDPYMRKTNVIYNFVDFSTYNESVKSNILREELGLSNKDVIFLMLARVSPENGVLEIVNQWKEYISNCHAHLIIVGEIQGREVEYCKKCHSAIGDVANIHILPFRKDAPQVIASSDVIICSFTQPHFARVIIEGAAMGKTAISVDIDGPKELIKHNITGFLYNNADELKYYVELLMKDKARRLHLGKEAEKYAREAFNADINANETIALYN